MFPTTTKIKQHDRFHYRRSSEPVVSAGGCYYCSYYYYVRCGRCHDNDNETEAEQNAHTHSVVMTTATSDVEENMPTECSAYAACADLKGDGCPNEKGVLLSCCLTPPPSPPTTTKCPSATLYYPLAIENTLGSRHILQAFPGMSPLVEGEEKTADFGLAGRFLVACGETQSPVPYSSAQSSDL